MRADSEVPSQAGSEQNEQVALVKSRQADQSRTAGRAAIKQIAEFYRRMWLIIGVTVMVAFGYYSAWSYLVPNYLCLDEIKHARVNLPPPNPPPPTCARARACMPYRNAANSHLAVGPHNISAACMTDPLGKYRASLQKQVLK